MIEIVFILSAICMYNYLIPAEQCIHCILNKLSTE